MKAQIIDGKAMARAINTAVKTRSEAFPETRKPCLVSLAVGEANPSTEVYVASQKKASARLGIRYDHIRIPSEAGRSGLLQRIEELNGDRSVHGIILQRPLPEGFDGLDVIQAVHPDKDVEGIHPSNLGAIAHGYPNFVPCTAEAAVRLYRSTGIAPRGLEVVVVGHSEIVGKPIALLLVHELATVTLCHIGTRDLKAHTVRADLLFVAAGVPGLIQADMVKPGSVVIDIGINRVSFGGGSTKGSRIVGDVDFEEVADVAGHITPVPGGVGPVTTAILMENVCKAAE